MVEDTHGKSHLSKFPVAHNDIRLEVPFTRTHTRKVDAILRFPIMLLQITQVISHHRNIGTPVFQADKYPHSYFMYPGLSHTVESIDPPVKFRLHPFRMIDVIICFVICLLKANHPIKSGMSKPFILLRFQRHYLYLQIRKVRLGQLQSPLNIGDPSFCRIFPGHKKQVLERSKLFYSLIFVHNLLFSQDNPRHGIIMIESAIDAKVRTRICNIERHKHRYSLAETLQSVLLTKPRHDFEVRLCSRRDKRLEVFHIKILFVQSRFHVGCRFRIDVVRSFFPRYFFKFF